MFKRDSFHTCMLYYNKTQYSFFFHPSSKTQVFFSSFIVHLHFMKLWLTVVPQLNDHCAGCRLSTMCGKLVEVTVQATRA